jgi:hypothetical protein
MSNGSDPGEGYVITDAWLDLTRERDLVCREMAAESIDDEEEEDRDFAQGVMWCLVWETTALLLFGFGWIIWCRYG